MELQRFTPLPLSVHPELAALHDEVAAEAAAPVQPLGQAVVGPVPAAILHDGQRQPRKHPVLSVGARHGLILREEERVREGGEEKTQTVSTQRRRERSPPAASSPSGSAPSPSPPGSPAPFPPRWDS